jgi:hypothetical protein
MENTLYGYFSFLYSRKYHSSVDSSDFVLLSSPDIFELSFYEISKHNIDINHIDVIIK